MVTQNEIIALARNGITFRLSNDGRFANMYYKDKFVDVLHNSNNKLYVCGKTLVGITCKELLNFLATHQCEVEIRKDLDDEEIFEIWKKSILEKRSASTFDKEYNRSKGYTYYHFKKLHLPKSYEEINALDSSTLDDLLQKKSYTEAKKILESL
ncbi:MAG: hypothetical protein Q4C11_00195 [Clostridium sp.]|nr:hypothetical protein [Clostridium sp.]